MKAHFFQSGLVLVFACSLVFTTYGKSVGELMTDLRTAVKESGENPSGGPQDEDAVPSLAQLETQLEKVLAQGGAEAPRVLTKMRARTESKKIQEICQELAQQIRTERDEKEAAFLDKVAAAVKQAGESALPAKSKPELETVLQTLNELQMHQPDATSDLGKRGIAQVAAAQQFVTDWQNYLVQMDKGQTPAARAILQGLVEHCTYPIVPRAEIQARLDALPAEKKPELAPAPTTMESIYAGLKEPEDLAQTLTQLKELSPADPGKEAAITELERLETFYHKLRIDLNPPPNLIEGSPRFLPLRLKLILLALPRYLGLPADFKAEPEETVGRFLNRVMAEAKTKENWPLLIKAWEASQLLTNSSADNTGTISKLATPMKSFLIGQNQEQAGQYSLAVLSYQEALKDTDNLVPVTIVRDRLEAMKKEHPKEFEEGLRQVLNSFQRSPVAPPEAGQ